MEKKNEQTNIYRNCVGHISIFFPRDGFKASVNSFYDLLIFQKLLNFFENRWDFALLFWTQNVNTIVSLNGILKFKFYCCFVSLWYVHIGFCHTVWARMELKILVWSWRVEAELWRVMNILHSQHCQDLWMAVHGGTTWTSMNYKQDHRH